MSKDYMQEQIDKLSVKIDALLEQGTRQSVQLSEVKSHLEKQNGRVFKNANTIVNMGYRIHDLEKTVQFIEELNAERKTDGNKLRWIIVAGVIGIFSSILTTYLTDKFF